MGTDIYLHAERMVGIGWEYCGELEDMEIRNYEFFAILANVRNPIRSKQPYNFISLPRGFPGDMSQELRKDSLLLGGHDPGWITLRELLDFDWDGKTMLRSAIVDPAYAHLFGDGNQKFPKEITGAYGLAHAGLGPRVTWIATYREAAGRGFLKGLLDKLKQFGRPDDVRIIFSFDS
jgi:hypothetical protein